MDDLSTIKNIGLKVVEHDFEVEFNIDCIITPYVKKNDPRRDYIKGEIEDIDSKVFNNNEKIENYYSEINQLTNQADGLDYIVAVGSGILAGLIDSFWVGQFSMERGEKWSNEQVNGFVMKVAKGQGYEGERLDGAIKFLENKYPIPSDNIWKGKNVGISAKSHHLDDLAHHPTPLGLFFSILTQFTSNGYFQNSNGDFMPISLDESGTKLLGHSIPSKLFAGTINWFFHLVSDMAGSNKTAGVGMGIPGPIISIMKELSMLPGFNKTGLAEKLKNIFVKEKFDLRSELAVGHEIAVQAVPVLINEFIVRAFYFIRRLVTELKEKGSFKEIEWKNTLPGKNRTIVRMLTIASSTFTFVDLCDAAIRSALTSGGNSAAFAKGVLMRVNFVGVGRVAIAITTDVMMGIKRSKLQDERMKLYSEQLHLMNAKVYYRQANMWITAESTSIALEETIALMKKIAIISRQASKENQSDLDRIGDYKDEIEIHNPELTRKISNILKWG